MPESCEATITLAGDLHARPAGALSVAAAVTAAAGGSLKAVLDAAQEARHARKL